MTKPKTQPRRRWRGMSGFVPDDDLSAAARSALLAKLPPGALADVCEMVAEERFLGRTPTRAEELAALDAVLPRLSALEAALTNLDELSAGRLEAAAFTDPKIRGGTPAGLSATLAAWRAAVARAQATAARRPSTRLERRITRRLQVIFARHRLTFSGSPTSKASRVLGIILAELGLPSKSPFNHIRAVTE